MKIATWFMVALFLGSIGCDKHHRAYRYVQLRSGATLKVISVGQMHLSSGTKAMILNYETTIPLTDHGRLEREADAIWSDFRKDVEEARLTNAIISASSPESDGMISRSSSFNFVYQRQPAGGWERLPSR